MQTLQGRVSREGSLPPLSTSMSTVGVSLSDRAEDNLRSVRRLRAMGNNIQSEIVSFTINKGAPLRRPDQAISHFLSSNFNYKL